MMGIKMELNLIIEKIEGEIQKLKTQKLENDANELIYAIVKINETKNNLFVYGAGRSGFIGKSFVMRIVQAGINAFFVGEPSMPPMHKNDLLVVISGTGKTQSVLSIMETSKKNLVDIILITSNHDAGSEFVDKLIIIEGKSKTDKTEALLPLGSFFEINAFIFLECIIGKIFKVNFKDNFKDISDRYRKGKIPII